VKITLQPNDARNFTAGTPVVLVDGRRIKGLRLTLWRLGQVARRLTRWWRPRTVVARMDLTTGTLTIATERWSWRRWRWERAEQVKAIDWRPL